MYGGGLQQGEGIAKGPPGRSVVYGGTDPRKSDGQRLGTVFGEMYFGQLFLEF